jgi:predicted TIM-barrel fold metal-dependent hydrolase
MLTRRAGIALLPGAMALACQTSAASAAASTVRTPVKFLIPRGACDCHVHVFPEPSRFPFWDGRGYTPPVATAGDLLALEDGLHIDRVVIVTPGVYGTDNRATLDGMRQLGAERARGVAVIGQQTSRAELEAMLNAGVRGVRVNLESNGVTDPSAAAANFDAVVAQIQGLPWHIQLYARLPLIVALKDRFFRSPVPLVFDHFAGAKAALGPRQAGFDTVLQLIRAGKAYVKLSGAYRASDLPLRDYADVAPLAEALLEMNPDRLLWGSDWPHPGPPGNTPAEVNTPFQVDDGKLLNLFDDWVPNPMLRRQILVENPKRLYGF